MGTRIYKSTDQTAITSSTWVKVTFDVQYVVLYGQNKSLYGMDALGFSDKYVSLSSNNAVITTSGSYNHHAQVRCTASRLGYREKLREILERTETGSFYVTYQGAGVARISVALLTAYANKGTPTIPVAPWYLTNKITVSGCTDPAYNITGNIVNFDTSSSWIEYDGIIGTPASPDTATAATIQVGIGHSPVIQGHSNVYSANNYQHVPVLGSGKLAPLLVNDKLWLEFWHEESGGAIDLKSGQFDCYMVFRREK